MNLHRHDGASLVVTLIILVIMSLGAIALVRSIDANLMVASNLAFRESAVLASDAGIEEAIKWLSARITSPEIYADQASQGYYASTPDELNGSGLNGGNAKIAIDWNDTNCDGTASLACQQPAPALKTNQSGNSVRYIIHRLCRISGSPDSASNSCLMYRASQVGSLKKGQISYGATSRFVSAANVYYRVTICVHGPRNTTVFTQALIHF
jgi:Tfp pilus assembly protein PilX